MRYDKPPLTYEDQYDLIASRGLQVEDRLRVIRWLKRVSYYRLSAYFLPFKNGETFRNGATFDHIAGLYNFDRKLRLVVLDAIERVEVSVRTCLTYELAHKYGPFGYSNPATFSAQFNHAGFMDDLRYAIDDSSETFVAFYGRKYTSEEHLPIWMASELLSFGVISRLYRASTPDIKKKIAHRFDIQDQQFASWLHAMSYARNLCAHHSRLWNRELAIKPSLPRNSKAWPYTVPTTDRLYCVLVILQHCLMRIAPRCSWKARLLGVFDAHPGVEIAAMGIPNDWRNMSPWA